MIQYLFYNLGVNKCAENIAVYFSPGSLPTDTAPGVEGTYTFTQIGNETSWVNKDDEKFKIWEGINKGSDHVDQYGRWNINQYINYSVIGKY